jgi:hypothetical protein
VTVTASGVVLSVIVEVPDEARAGVLAYQIAGAACGDGWDLDGASGRRTRTTDLRDGNAPADSGYSGVTEPGCAYASREGSVRDRGVRAWLVGSASARSGSAGGYGWCVAGRRFRGLILDFAGDVMAKLRKPVLL